MCWMYQWLPNSGGAFGSFEALACGYGVAAAGAFGAAAGSSGAAGASRSIAPSGNSAVDGLLSGSKWQSNVLTYSFPVSKANYGYAASSYTDFKSFSVAQMKAVGAILGDYASFANLKFVNQGSAPSVLRFAESDAYDTGYAFYPSGSEDGGDVWLNSSSGWYKSPVAGNYAFLTLIHEIGHALGLKHANEATNFGAVPASVDGMPYTVMTYAAYVGAAITGSYTNAWDSYAQSPMRDDVAALQKLYGANFAFRNGNTVYSWNPVTGEEYVNGVGQGRPVANKVFETVWDGGGTDTYDFSKFKSNLKIDLTPGAWSTLDKAQLANLSGNGKVLAPGNIANAYQYNNSPASLIENAIGGSGNDVIKGNAAANTLTGGAGNDILTGGSGHDTFVFRPGFGHDVVTDFQTKGLDHDTLDLRGLGLSGFSDLLAHVHAAAHGTLISIDDHDTILLIGVSKTQLAHGHSGDFQFF